MKITLKLMVLIVLIYSFTISCKKEDPVEYNNSIIKLQREAIFSIDNLKKNIDAYSTAYQESSINNINKSYDSSYFLISKNIDLLKSMKPYKNDDTLRIAAIALFNVYIDILENYYKPLIEIYKLPADKFTNADHEAIANYDFSANKKLDNSFKKFSEIQIKFSRKYKLLLE